MALDKKKVLNEIKIFALMILVVTSLRSALADWNDVPTGSMKPTIQIGDRVVVNKLAYDLKIPFTTVDVLKWGDPQRGDIVVLFSPEDGTRLVKRVVATPGDRVAMINNQLYVNDERAAWSPMREIDAGPDDGPAFVLNETLAGVTYQVMFMRHMSGSQRSIAPFVVPEGHYYVLGDNRDNSNDSRYIGPIPRDRIVGKATAVAFSLDHSRWRPRLDRFFVELN